MQHKETIHHVSRIVLSFTFFLTAFLFGILLASNSLSSLWIPSKVLVFFGWVLLVCTALGMILFIADRD